MAGVLSGVTHRSTAAIGLGTCVLLAAAVWNRFPLTFWDTRAYLIHSITLVPRVDRVIGYSLFIRALDWSGSLWPVVVAQAALVSSLAWLVARLVVRRVSPLRFVTAMVILAGGTALPWIAGQLMPDIFTPILLLALFALVLGWRRVGVGVRLGLLAVVALSAAVHVTHATFGVLLIVSLLLISWRTGRRSLEWRGAIAGLLALGLGVMAMLGFNHSRTGRYELVPGGSAFVLAHLVESGLASRLLDEHCGKRAYLLCPYRAALPMSTDEFLWQDRLPFHPFEQLEATRAETRRLLIDSWREHPGQQIAVAFEYSAGALSRFGTGEGLDSLALPGLDSIVAVVAPRQRPALNSARQQHNLVPVALLRAWQTPLGWAAILLGMGLTIVAWYRGRRWRSDRAVQYLLAALSGMLIYAVLCGNTSGIYDRYESRLVWLVTFGLWLAAERGWRRHEISRLRTTAS